MRILGLVAGMVILTSSFPSAGPAAEPGPSLPAITLEPLITKGLHHPVYVTHAKDGSGRLFIVEQSGRIRVVQNNGLLNAPFLDISPRVRSSGAEQGLLGMAFHPQFRSNGRYVVHYTRNPDGAIVIAEFRVSSDQNRSDVSEKILLVVPHPYSNHNAGMLEFGPDGLLYLGMGDGGSRGDPDNRGQNKNELLGKMLRIDVDRGQPYAIPPDNPFVSGGGRPEIYAYGIRNPWRFSFDRTTGELWVADVGQNAWEEIDVIQSGGNYGWRVMEGRHCFVPKGGCPTAGLTQPVAEYANRAPRCSITGGYVYRGKRIPALRGVYVFGDYCSGEIFALTDREVGTIGTLLKTEFGLASFGEDIDGEIFVVDHRGDAVYRMVPGTTVSQLSR